MMEGIGVQDMAVIKAQRNMPGPEDNISALVRLILFNMLMRRILKEGKLCTTIARNSQASSMQAELDKGRAIYAAI
jgi:hypothetical protein